MPAFPLKPGANGRHLVDQNGVPFLIHGDTMWMWFIKKAFASMSDIERYLDDRSAKGFTTIQFMTAWKTKEIGNVWTVFPDVDGNAPFTEEAAPTVWRIDRPNDAYFEHIRRIVEGCAQRGLLASLCPLWLGAGGNQGFHEEMNHPHNADEICFGYGQYLGRLLQAFDNVLWMHGGDRVPNATEERRHRKIMDGIKSVHARSLHTAHWRRPPDVNLSREMPLFRDQLDVEMVYSASITYYGCLRHWRNELKLPTAPAFMGESYYELQPRFTPPGAWPVHLCRRQAYWSILSGAGHVYGIETPTMDDLDLPGTLDMQRVYEVFSKRRWYDLVPDIDHRIVTQGYGTPATDTAAAHENDDYVVAASATDGRLLMAYVPPTGTGPRSITVDMNDLADVAAARWFNPTNGQYVPAGAEYYSSLAEAQPLTTPGDNGSGQNDWLLIVETAS